MLKRLLKDQDLKSPEGNLISYPMALGGSNQTRGMPRVFHSGRKVMTQNNFRGAFPPWNR